jgi:hypothetical protein
MSNPARIGQEAPDLKTPSSPSRITPTRALDDDAEHIVAAALWTRPSNVARALKLIWTTRSTRRPR